MKAHQLAALLLAGPDVEVVMANHNETYGDSTLYAATKPERLSMKKASRNSYTDYQSEWGDFVLLIN